MGMEGAAMGRKARTKVQATGRPGPGSLGEGDRGTLVSAMLGQILGQRVERVTGRL